LIGNLSEWHSYSQPLRKAGPSLRSGWQNYI